MNITWVLSNNTEVDPTVDINRLKNIGPFWGGWKTWRSYTTDNVVCHDVGKAIELVNRNFQDRCNLYIPESAYRDIGRPTNVKLYQGEFNLAVDDPEDIVSMHLAASKSDIVLLLGFDLSTKNYSDKLESHKWQNYQNYFRHIVTESNSIQWVLLDQGQKINKELKKVSNLQFDTLENVLTQF